MAPEIEGNWRDKHYGERRTGGKGCRKYREREREEGERGEEIESGREGGRERGRVGRTDGHIDGGTEGGTDGRRDGHHLAAGQLNRWKKP